MGKSAPSSVQNENGQVRRNCGGKEDITLELLNHVNQTVPSSSCADATPQNPARTTAVPVIPSLSQLAAPRQREPEPVNSLQRTPRRDDRARDPNIERETRQSPLHLE